MNEDVIADLLVKLSAEVDKFAAGMKEAISASEHAAKAVEENTKKMEDSTKGLGESVKGVIEGLASLGEFKWLEGAIEKAEEAKIGMQDLESAIKLNGSGIEKTIESHKKYADKISKTTMLTKGQTIAMLEQVEGLGLTGKNAELAIDYATKLGAVTKFGAQAMTQASAEIVKGNYTYAQRMLKLRGVRNETELLALIDQRAAYGQEKLNHQMESANAKLEKMQQEFGAIRKMVGMVVLEAYEPYVDALVKLFHLHEEIPKTIKDLAIAVLSLGVVVTTLQLTWMALAKLGITPYIAAAGRAIWATIGLTAAQVRATVVSALTAAWSLATASLTALRTALVSTTLSLQTFRLASLAIIAGGAALAYAIYNMDSNVKNLNKELERSKELAGKLEELNDKKFQNIVMQKDGNQEEYLKELTSRAEEYESQIVTLTNQTEKFKTSLDFKAQNWFASIDVLNILRENIKNNEEAIEIAKKAAIKYREEIEKLAGPEAKIHDTLKAKEYLHTLEKEIKTIGLTTEQAKLNEFAQKQVNKEILNQIKIKQDLKDLDSRVNESNKNQSKYVLDTLKEIENIGKTASQIKLDEVTRVKINPDDKKQVDEFIKKRINSLKLQQEGVGFGEGVNRLNKSGQGYGWLELEKELRNYTAEVKKHIEQMSLLADVTVKDADRLKIFSLIQDGATDSQVRAALALARQSKAIEEALKLNEEYAAPHDKFKEKMDGLNRALATGALEYDAYTKAVLAAREELDKLDDSASGVQGTLEGSADAIGKVNAYTEQLYRQSTEGLQLYGAQGPESRGRFPRRSIDPDFNAAVGSIGGGAALSGLATPGGNNEIQVLKEIRDLLKISVGGGVSAVVKMANINGIVTTPSATK